MNELRLLIQGAAATAGLLLIARVFFLALAYAAGAR